MFFSIDFLLLFIKLAVYIQKKVWYNTSINKNDSVKLDGCRLDAGAVPAASTIISLEVIMDEVLLWQFRKFCVEYICINNYSPRHARLIMMGAK